MDYPAKRNHYLEKYGVVPEFKAGMHLGLVTAVEVGSIKREIAYHGDTINTASRIQGKCNELDQTFLISETVKEAIENLNRNYQYQSMGEITLRGKDHSVELYGVERRDSA